MSEEVGSRELRALLVLDALPGVGPRALLRTVRRFGSATAALAAPARDLAACVGPEAAGHRADGALVAAVDRGLAVARTLGMRVLHWGDEAYPERLRHLADPPPVLFLRGRPELLEPPGVAVVGARRATARGRDVARRLGRALGRAGVPVTSGLALGVDGAAHRGALDAGGSTVAVLGRGADRAYPAAHDRLYRRVVADGLAVSEFLPGTPALPHHFPRRNRILAALSRSVVVVEAGARSGALITVDHALDLGLDVYAVPGPIDGPSCAGSNALLRDGARPLVSVSDFVAGVAPDASRPRSRHRGEPGDEGRVLGALERGAASVDEIARGTGLSAPRALGMLTALELAGRVERVPGARFVRVG